MICTDGAIKQNCSLLAWPARINVLQILKETKQFYNHLLLLFEKVLKVKEIKKVQ